MEAFWAQHSDKDARLGVDVELSGDFTVPAGSVLVLEGPGAITVPEGKTLTISGTLVNNNNVRNYGTIEVIGDGGLLLNHDTVWNYGQITGSVKIEQENMDVWPEFYQYAALEDDGTENWGWKLNPLPDIKMGEENGSVIAAVRVDWDDREGVYALRAATFLEATHTDGSVYTEAAIEVRGDWENGVSVTMTIPENTTLKLPDYMTLAIINSYTTLDVQGAISGTETNRSGTVQLVYGAALSKGSRDKISVDIQERK